MMVKGMTGIENARFLMDSWIMAGLLGITSMTTTMGAFGVMVDKKEPVILPGLRNHGYNNERKIQRIRYVLLRLFG